MGSFDIDTTPEPGALIRVLQTLKWSAKEAIAELIDNSFGAARGNASLAWVQWHKNKRILGVFDDGQGMDDIGALFQIKRFHDGFTPGDIGRYGFGGTFALAWLADRVTVWTLRDGVVSWVEVDWHKQAKRSTHSMRGHMERSTAKNTPTALMDSGHGTYIELHVASKRQIRPSDVRRDLARQYGPSLRHGKRLYWRTSGEELVPLADQIEIPEAMPVHVAFELDGYALSAHGEAGVVPDLDAEGSRMALCFGPRMLEQTKDCYTSPEGDRTYNGLGVTGYVDLSDEWMEGEFLSTTKSTIDDKRAEKALMAGLFQTLEPLLKEVEHERRNIKIRVALNEMQDMFNRHAFSSELEDADEGEEAEGDQEGGGKVITPGPGDAEISIKPRVKHQRNRKSTGISLNLEPAANKDIKNLICRIELQGSTFTGFLNRDYERLIDQFEGKREDRNELYAHVASEVARAALHNGDDSLVRSFPLKVRNMLDRSGEWKHSLLTRLLLDRVNGNKSPSKEV